MMIFAGHVGISLITAWALGLNPLITLIGGILPDLDALLTFLGKKWGEAHRKITHSLIFTAGAFIISTPLGVGVLTHLIADMDHWGVPLLYPFKKKEYSIMKVDHKRGNNYLTLNEALKSWFKDRNIKFWTEWALLALGITLTWTYWTNLIIDLLTLFY